MCLVFQPVTALACLKQTLCLAWRGFVLHSSASHKDIASSGQLVLFKHLQSVV